MDTNVLIAIFSILILIVSSFVSIFILKDYKKIATVFIIMAFLLGCFLTYVQYKSSSADTQQKKNIERYSQIADSLGIEIKKIDSLNSELTTQTSKIISTIQAISNNIYKKTKEYGEENALAGTLKFTLKKELSDLDIIIAVFGQITTGNTVSQIKNWHTHPIVSGNKVLLDWDIVDNNICITTTIFDINGNWIVDINKNEWRRNPNYTGKFNYDAKGFEIIDNQNIVALNFDLQTNNLIQMHGYLVDQENHLLLVSGNSHAFSLRVKPNGENIDEIFYKFKEADIKQIFRYTGENWLHSRLNDMGSK